MPAKIGKRRDVLIVQSGRLKKIPGNLNTTLHVESARTYAHDRTITDLEVAEMN